MGGRRWRRRHPRGNTRGMRRPSPQQDDTRTTVQLRHPTLACNPQHRVQRPAHRAHQSPARRPVLLASNAPAIPIGGTPSAPSPIPAAGRARTSSLSSVSGVAAVFSPLAGLSKPKGGGRGGWREHHPVDTSPRARESPRGSRPAVRAANVTGQAQSGPPCRRVGPQCRGARHVGQGATNRLHGGAAGWRARQGLWGCRRCATHAPTTRRSGGGSPRLRVLRMRDGGKGTIAWSTAVDCGPRFS